MVKNVFVLGLLDQQRGELETVSGAGDYAFHGLLDYQRLVGNADYVFEDLLAAARSELDAFDGSVDAIVAHWDFPTSVLAPILAAEHGLPSPSLESVLKCEHKYWSRLQQLESVPECVPAFASFDPFDDDALEKIDLDYPFWVKPVKAHSSSLGFEIQNKEEFAEAVRQIREEIGGIGDAFNEVLSRVTLPPELDHAGGNTCLAEQFITGTQAAPEGTVFNGRFHAHGVFDMYRDSTGTSIERLDYPAHTVPQEVQQRMIDVCERYLDHVGYDNGCFNAEFMWDEEQQKLWLIEFNTRISQSHSDLFAKVDGASNHEVAIDMALGQPPTMPHRKGPFAVASQCMIFHDEDAVVTKVPSDEDIARVEKMFPETLTRILAKPGDRLSELRNQASYRYILGDLYLGADSRDELVQRFDTALSELPFEFEPAGGKDGKA